LWPHQAIAQLSAAPAPVFDEMERKPQ